MSALSLTPDPGYHPPAMLQINEASLRAGGQLLLDRATVSIRKGQKAALIGRNGAGKSTLLRAILSEHPVESGTIEVHRRATVAAVAQQAPSGPATLLDTVLSADRERIDLLTEADSATDPHRIAAIHERLSDIDAHSAPARAAAILSGLGFDRDAQERPLDDFSGGWRMRVALAATLFRNPDLLLLDEPSNHLDLEARLWLEGFLASFQGTVILVSHDRGLINAMAKAVIHLEQGKLTAYRGDYDAFQRARAERAALAAAQAAKQLAQRRKMEAFVERFRAKASKARQAQSRIKALERLGPISAVRPDDEVVMDLPDPEPLSPPLISLESAVGAYADGRAVLRDLDLRIDMDDRIGLLGANGNGKTTLLRLLSGELKPASGAVRRSSKLKIGYFAQEQMEVLKPDQTAYAALAELMPDVPEAKVRAHLGRFGFIQHKADTRVSRLSGGEKAKLVLARITRAAPQILLLDEPTNHLDIESRQALITALNSYDGAVVLVSHDPELLELCCDRLWLVAGGSCRPFEGDLAEYRRSLLLERRAASSTRRTDKPVAKPSRKQSRRESAQARASVAPLRRAAEQAERQVENLAARREQLLAKLADPKLYEDEPATVSDLQKELGEIERALKTAEASWIEAHEALESACSA